MSTVKQDEVKGTKEDPTGNVPVKMEQDAGKPKDGAPPAIGASKPRDDAPPAVDTGKKL